MTQYYKKTGLIILSALLLAGIVVGYYELLGPKTVIDLFFIPSFIIAATLTLSGRKRNLGQTAEKTD